MNAKTLIAAVTLLTSAGAVFAGNVESVSHNSNFVSTKTRAEVTAELQQVAAKGGMTRNHDAVNHNSNFVSAKTRDEVRNEAIQVANSSLFNSYIGR
jgi:glycerol kinase